ncbi:uncharacterized protein LOC134730723 [Pan paniscus]|uniref:uncharacterized protein LOC134730723 n=1 Tax=Pan paniscus TaxID=9597 RepID=UPI003004C514
MMLAQWLLVDSEPPLLSEASSPMLSSKPFSLWASRKAPEWPLLCRGSPWLLPSTPELLATLVGSTHRPLGLCRGLGAVKEYSHSNLLHLVHEDLLPVVNVGRPPRQDGLNLPLEARVQQGGQHKLLAVEELVELTVGAELLGQPLSQLDGCAPLPDTLLLKVCVNLLQEDVQVAQLGQHLAQRGLCRTCLADRHLEGLQELAEAVCRAPECGRQGNTSLPQLVPALVLLKGLLLLHQPLQQVVGRDPVVQELLKGLVG